MAAKAKSPVFPVAARRPPGYTCQPEYPARERAEGILTRGGPTMKTAFKILMCLAVVFAATAIATVRADDDKDVKTLKGELGCAKCVFKVSGITKCTNAIKVKEGDKEVIYLFDDMGAKEPYHKKICTDTAKGQVKGKVTKKDDKLYIKPEKDSVKYDDA
jgi:hypothetical protein